MVHRFVSGLLGVVLSAAMAAAQSLSVPASLAAGQDINIEYADRSRAGQTVTVTIDEYTDHRVIVELTIHLDQSGRGSVTYSVPDVDTVAFNAPGARQVTRAL